MQTFLIAVAGVVFGLLVVAALGVFWLKRKLRGVGKALSALASSLTRVSPFRITLLPLNVAAWRNGDDMIEASTSLESAGYQRVGDFEVSEMEDVLLRGFWHPQRLSYAVVYDHPQAGVFADVVGMYRDRSLLTVSTCPETGMDRHPRSPILRMELEGADEFHRLHERLVAETAGREPIATAPEQFMRAVEGAYWMEMRWRIQRGGVTADEVRRAAAAGGQEPPDDCAVELVQAGWRSAIAAFVEQEVLKAWLDGNPVPAAEWEEQRERIRGVHDHCDGGDLADELAWSMIAGSCDEEDDAAEDRAHAEARSRLAPLFSGSAVAGFAAALELLPEKRRPRRLGSVAKPFAGDVYLEPEDEAL
ncbi:MAG: hypothetical protein ACQGVC_23205 [Myxococcota bacterium]